MSMNKYLSIFHRAIDNYQKSHPHWGAEVLISLIKWGLVSLRHYIEDARASEISWDRPFVELHYPVDWNWKERVNGDVAIGEHICGKITNKNTANKKIATKTLSKIMTNWFNATMLAQATNGAWYEKLNNFYMPVLPIDYSRALNSIKSKRARREAFQEIVRPFSIGGVYIDKSDVEFKDGARVPKQVARRLANILNLTGIPRIDIAGAVNGRKIKMSLIFQIHPLIADYDQKKAYHPITVGLFIEPELSGKNIVTRTPSSWSKSDRKLLWDELLSEIGRSLDSLIPNAAEQDSIILTINSKIRIPAGAWHPENRGASIKRIAELQSQVGDLMGISVQLADGGQDGSKSESCPVCGWNHDRGFTQIKIGNLKPICLGGILPEIVRLVHGMHEKGFAGLSTKDDELLKACAGYRNPCKAFDDLNRRHQYKQLFDTSRRGFISLRGMVGRKRNKSEGCPE